VNRKDAKDTKIAKRDRRKIEESDVCQPSLCLCVFAVDLISTALLCLSCVTLEGDENVGAFTN